MATNKKGGRPPTHWWIAEQIYLLVSETERLNPGITRRQAIYKVMDSDKYKNILNLYYDAIIKIQNNHRHKLADYQDKRMHDPEEISKDMAESGYMYLEPETGEFFTQEDLDQIKAEYQDIRKHKQRLNNQESGYIRSNLTRLRSTKGCWNTLREDLGIEGVVRMARKTLVTLGKDAGLTNKQMKYISHHDQEKTIDIHYDKGMIPEIQKNEGIVAKIYKFQKKKIA